MSRSSSIDSGPPDTASSLATNRAGGEHVGKPTVNRVAVRKVGVPDSDQDGESAVAWTSQHVQDHVTQTRVGPLEVVDQHDQRRLTYDVLHPVVDRPDRVSCVDASQAGAGEVLGRADDLRRAVRKGARPVLRACNGSALTVNRMTP